jgi:hypothetical protein
MSENLNGDATMRCACPQWRTTVESTTEEKKKKKKRSNKGRFEEHKDTHQEVSVMKAVTQ